MRVLAVTTYNRLEYLKALLQSFDQTRSKARWKVIVADDGSTDGTIEYVSTLELNQCEIQLIRNERNGIHHQFNTIVRELQRESFEICFKCDDDILFLKPGWDELYIEAIKASGYEHLCYFNMNWRPGKRLQKPVRLGSLVGNCLPKDVQGSFFTLTPGVIRAVGFMDTLNFGFRGVGHIDYTMRACRAGFNQIDHPFDVAGSNDYIGNQEMGYRTAMNEHLVHALENDSEGQRKYTLIQDASRVYIDFYENAPSLTPDLERRLLMERLDTLEKEKGWYENNYGHQPVWYVRLGKLLFKAIRR